jgi:energy-coupling factor transporter ATP-binding protein EcfA2
MLTVDEVVEVLKITRNEFAFVFLQAQYNDLPVGERTEFEAVGRAVQDKEAFRDALRYAELKGFYIQVLKLLMNYGYDKGAFLELLKAKYPDNTTLQGIVRRGARIAGSGDYLDGIGRATRWTGKVLINDDFKGSGVLIGPTSFLTAWHVVFDMFDVDPATKTYNARQPAPKLEVVFDDILNKVNNAYQPQQQLKVRAADNWYETYSTCSPEELNKNVTTYGDLEGFWDYAIIKLKEIPGNERTYAKLNRQAVVPTFNSDIMVFQHPKAAPMGNAPGRIYDLQPPDIAIPRIRFLHDALTEDGSSGGPCFDIKFELVGIHQGQSVVRNQPINIGVPIVNIILDLKERLKNNECAQLKEDFFINSLDNQDYAPVIGCDDFQALVLGMANVSAEVPAADASANETVGPILFTRSSEANLMLIKGDKGSGKSFLIKVLSVLLPDTEHLKIILSAQSISKMTVEQLVDSLASLIGNETNNIQPSDKYNSTKSTWIKDEVIDNVTEMINAKRNNRLVWICVTDMNLFEIENQNTQDFLFFLVERLLTNNWVRIFLDGTEAGLPKSLEQKAETFKTRKATQSDITNYLKRFAKQLKQNIEEQNIEKTSTALFTIYEGAYVIDEASAFATLSQQCKRFFNKYIDQVKGKST